MMMIMAGFRVEDRGMKMMVRHHSLLPWVITGKSLLSIVLQCSAEIGLAHYVEHPADNLTSKSNGLDHFIDDLLRAAASPAYDESIAEVGLVSHGEHGVLLPYHCNRRV